MVEKIEKIQPMTTHTACEAMEAAGAERPWFYAWFGDEVEKLEDASPGDILTFKDCRFKWKTGSSTGSMAAGAPNHTAVPTL